MFCMYTSNVVENPIHLLLCLTPAVQGCGELFSLDTGKWQSYRCTKPQSEKHFVAFQTAAARSLL